MTTLQILTFFAVISLHYALSTDKIVDHDLERQRQRVVRMFQHAYDGYMKYAYPLDELRPLTCDGQDTWGSFSLTLIDALDTLAIMGNYSEFRRVAHLLVKNIDFNIDINVSVFETNIRVVGGLLSAHLFSRRAGMTLEPGWPCSGPLLRLAEDVARRLLPAFDTPTGMPYGTVNLRYGVPVSETTVTCTSGVTTFIVEFASLSRLTGDPVFEKVALIALRAIWDRRSEIGLVGNHIDISTGKWTALDAGIGGGIDSYFEYLVKGSIMLQSSELLEMYREYERTLEKYVKRDDWYLWANMNKGSITLPVFQSLDAFWPGMQSLVGDIDPAMKTIHNYHQVWRQFGFTPEIYNVPRSEVHTGREGYPLRPEFIESVMYLYRATSDPYLLQVGRDVLESIEHSTKTNCGYATVRDVTDHKLENRMESFFLAETTKYLYLLFTPDSFIHNPGSHGDIIETPNGECVVDAGGYVFNTEAHPVDMASVYCCSAQRQHDDQVLQDLHNNLDLLTLLNIVSPAQDIFAGQKLRKKNSKSVKYHNKKKIFEKNIVTGESIPNKEVTPPSHKNQSSSPDLSPSPNTSNIPGTPSYPDGETESLEDIFDESLDSLFADEKDVQSANKKKIRQYKLEDDKDIENVINMLPKTPSISSGKRSKLKNHGWIDSKTIDKTSDIELLLKQILKTTGSDSNTFVGNNGFSIPSNKAKTRQIKSHNTNRTIVTKWDMLVCPSQPFYRRLSIMGEMFVDIS